MDPRLLIHGLTDAAYAMHRTVTFIATILNDQARSAGYGDYILLARAALICAAMLLTVLQIEAAAAGRYATAILARARGSVSEQS